MGAIIRAAQNRWRGIIAIALLLVCLALPACASGIPAGSYHYSKLAIEIYEGLPIAQGKGFTRAFVSCDPDEKLIGGGFRSDGTQAAPQIVASYPSDYAGNEVAAGVAPTTWTVEGYSPTGGGHFNAYALCLDSPSTAQVAISTASGSIAPNTSAPITAVCPNDTTVLGGGFVTHHTTAPDTDALPSLIALYPYGNTLWTVTMRASATARSAVMVESIAVCVVGPIGTALPQSQVYIGTGAISTPSAVSPCPANQALTGGGFSPFPDGEQPPSFITSDYPQMDGATAVWDIGWQRPPTSEVIMTIWTICGYAYN